MTHATRNLNKVLASRAELVCLFPDCDLPWSAHITKRGTVAKKFKGHSQYAIKPSNRGLRRRSSRMVHLLEGCHGHARISHKVKSIAGSSVPTVEEVFVEVRTFQTPLGLRKVGVRDGR